MSKTTKDPELEQDYLSRIINDTRSNCSVDVRYSNDIIWAKIWLQVKPYGFVNLEGWSTVQECEKFAKKAHANLTSYGNLLQLKAKVS